LLEDRVVRTPEVATGVRVAADIEHAGFGLAEFEGMAAVGAGARESDGHDNTSSTSRRTVTNSDSIAKR
jgi:hypothetical protein